MRRFDPLFFDLECRLLTRRQFHRRLAAIAAAASLPAINPRAWAAAAPAKRLVLMWSLGTDNTLWRPTSQPGAPLTLPVATQPLDKVKEHIIMVDGLSFLKPNDQHSTYQPFTGASSSDSPNPGTLRGSKFLSADQYILAKQQMPTRTQCLTQGVAAKNESLIFNGGRQQTTDDPASSFATVFKGVQSPATQAAPDPNAFPRQAILDQVSADVKELQGVLGKEARSRLDQHLTALEELERNAAPLQTGGACNPTAPTTTGDSGSDANSTAVAAAQFQLIAQAFACDVTRIASLQWGISNRQPVLMDGQMAPKEEHSDGVHAPSNDVINACEATVARVFADFVSLLANTPDPSGQGTVLDNTLIMWTRDMGFAQAHTMYPIPTVLAGAPSYLKLASGGTYVRGSGDDKTASQSSVSHDAVLLNCLEWMGVTDYSGFGVKNGATAPFADVKK